MGVCQSGALGLNRAADGVEAGEVGRDQATRGLQCLCPESAWGPWKDLSSRGTACAPGVEVALESGGELFGKGKAGG